MTKPDTFDLLRAAVEGEKRLRRSDFYLWLQRHPREAAVLAKAERRKNWVAVVKALEGENLEVALPGGARRALTPGDASKTFWRFWNDQKKTGRAAAVLASLDAVASAAAPAEAPPPTRTRQRFRTTGTPQETR